MLFILVETLFFQLEPVLNLALSLTGGYSWLIMLGGFMLITNYAERLALRNDDVKMHYAGLVLYVIAEAFIFIPLIFIAMGLIVAGILFGFDLGLWFSVGMVILASGSILYQTSNLIHKYQEHQHVAAALGLFASLMLLFWYILSILSRD